MENESFLEKRRCPRVEAKLPVRFQVRDSGKNGSSVTYNLSEAGVQMLANEFLPVNRNLLVEFFLFDNPMRMVSAVAHVVWNKQLPYTDNYKVGLAFDHISDEAKKNIGEFVNSRLAF